MASVIKAPGRTAGATSLALEEFSDDSPGVLEHARRQAAEILALAEQEAIAIRTRAETAARQAALDTAEQVVEERLADRLETLWPALSGAIDNIETSKAHWLAHWEQAALDVATAIAARVIRREVAQDPQVTLALVKEALELAAGSAQVSLRMHPHDLSALGDQIERVVAQVSRVGKVEVLADATIEQGGCRVETRFGSIDQQFAAQLQRIAEELR